MRTVMSHPKFQYDYKHYVGYKWPHCNLSDMRSEKLGTYRTSSLFRETLHNYTNQTAIYTLSEEEKFGLPSAYQIYMNSVDEYDAALKLVGTVAHWKRLLNCTWFMEGKGVPGFPGLLSWREDKLAKDASDARRTLMDQIQRGNVSAAQSLLNKYTPKNSVGRPNKPEDNLEEIEKMNKIVQLAKGISK